jgi:Rieske Fe-S protein
MILNDLLTGRASAWTRAFDATRIGGAGAVADAVMTNVHAGARLLKDHMETAPAATLDDIAVGEGRVVDRYGGKVAVHRDGDGRLRAVDATCTHLGCIVRWNDAETTWDCPCHGSRYAADGRVIDGPATSPLQPYDLGREAR